MDDKPSGETALAGFAGGADSARWGISVRNDMHLRVWSGADTADQIVTTTPLALSTWTHLVATFDAPTKRIGLVVDTTVYPRNTVAFPTASRQPVVGGIGFPGAFDEIRLSDTARNTEWSQLERQTQSGVPWLRW
jgi:hypothetical protein